MATDKAMVTDAIARTERHADEDNCPPICGTASAAEDAALAQAEQPVAWTSAAQLKRLEEQPSHNHRMWAKPLPYHDDIPLYLHPPAKREAGETAASGAPAPESHVVGTLDALRRAERFMSGFEGDEMQEGIDADLAAIREAIEQAEASA